MFVIIFVQTFGDIEEVPGSISLSLHVSSVSIIRISLVCEFISHLLHMLVLISSEVQEFIIEHLGAANALLVHCNHIVES
jgi:hypothetical protein